MRFPSRRARGGGGSGGVLAGGPTIDLSIPIVGAKAGNASFTYTLIDPQSDLASIQVEYSVDGGVSFSPATPGPGGDGTTGLTSSPTGILHTFVWDTVADTVGMISIERDVVLRFTATDNAAGPPAVTLAFTVYNNAKYTLNLIKTTAVPAGSATGIATDQTYFWVISGGHNATTHTLRYFDPDTQTVFSSFDFTNIIEQPGTGVGGITWDGTYVWISVSGTVNKLVEVDPATGNIQRSFSSPAFLGPTDLDWDGVSLWLNSGTGEVYFINPINGGNTPLPVSGYSSGRNSGIVVRNDEVWTGEVFTKDLRLFDSTTGALVALLPDALHDRPDSMCIFGGQLVVLGGGSLKFYDIIVN